MSTKLYRGNRVAVILPCYNEVLVVASVEAGWRPAVAVAIGSLLGMLTNLTAAQTLVFRAKRQG